MSTKQQDDEQQKAKIKEFLEFKITQYCRLRSINIPKDAKGQEEILSNIDPEIKKAWAGEFFYATKK